MPLLTKIRNNLSIALALSSAVFAGYAYITHLQYSSLEKKTKIINQQKNKIEQTNKKQTEIIKQLTEQRALDDEILRLLAEQHIEIRKQGENVRFRLEELAENDESIRNLFNLRLPPSAIQLLNNQVRGSTAENIVDATAKP